MQIKLEKHSYAWKERFLAIRDNLSLLLSGLQPEIEHVGSTAVEGLSAKPIIDILVGLKNEAQLDSTVAPLTEHQYIYFSVYNKDMPYRRFFVKHKTDPSALGLPPVIRTVQEIPHTTEEHDQRLAHIHIVPLDSEHWTRHIAFRDYLLSHPEVKEEYQGLKEHLVHRDWADGNAYNGGKDPFIKMHEKAAVNWYSLNKI